MKREQIKVFIAKDKADKLRKEAFNNDLPLSKLVRNVLINYLNNKDNGINK